MQKRARIRHIMALALIGILAVQLLGFTAPDVSAASAPTYRALLIGNNAYAQNPLQGCINDAKALQSALKNSTSIKYAKTELKTNLTASGIAQAITDLQGWGIQSSDVTLVYYSGHGYTAGSETGLVGVDNYAYSFAKMEQVLDALPGSIILLLDSCYSGGAIGKNLDQKTKVTSKGLADYNQSIVDAFSSKIKSKAMTGSKYHVITAASATQQSFESGQYGGLFTYGLTQAIGWDYTTGKALSKLQGDTNGDVQVSIHEAYLYAKDVVSDLQRSAMQVVQSSPSGSTMPLVARKTSTSTDTPSGGEPDNAPDASGLPNVKTAALSPGQMLRLSGESALNWKSSNGKVASVSSAGLVTAKAKGKTVITGSLGSKKLVKCNVSVVSSGKVVSQVTLNSSAIERGVGTSIRLKAKFVPSKPYSKKLRWYSADKSVASVSASGVVKARAIGETKVYAIASSGVVASCDVVVTPRAVSKVRQKAPKASLQQGKTLRLRAKALPAAAQNRALKWSSADSGIAAVDEQSGLVTGVAPGKVYIKATSTDGTNKSARCLVTVRKK